MHLLNTSTFRIGEFQDNEVPPYAILSHWWLREEVTYEDMMVAERWGVRGVDKAGFAKLELIVGCAQAREDELEFIWIDTCCI
jgi:hypothetical protein